MYGLNTEEVLIVICSLVVLSYLFSIVSRYIRIPSVLLLLFAGIGFRAVADLYQWNFFFSDQLIESLGVVGLIMIVLEAGLDLKVGKDKLKLIRDSFFSALFIFVFSTVLLTIILNYWLGEPFNKCLVYAIPLSIMSSSIVIPSINPLNAQKRNSWCMKLPFPISLALLCSIILPRVISCNGGQSACLVSISAYR